MKVKVVIGSIQEAPYGSFGTDAIVDSDVDKVPVDVMRAWVANGWAEEVVGVVEVKEEEKPKAAKSKASTHKKKEGGKE